MYAASLVPAVSIQAQTPAPDFDLYGAVASALRDEVADETGGISTYTLDVRLDPETRTIGGQERIAFVNQTATPLTEVYFRLFPNADYYGEGDLHVDHVQIGAETIDNTELIAADTILRVPLPQPLATDDVVEIGLDFTTTVPADSNGSYGIFNYDTGNATWILADWYPIVAGYEPDVGWRLEPPTPAGDPTFSETALYDVTLSAPSTLVVVASGTATEENVNDDSTRRRYVTGPARDFALVADDNYTAVSEQVDETMVTVYANPENADGSTAAVRAAARALRTYSDAFGPYPFTELDVVDTPLASALAVSWTGIIFFNSGRLLPANTAGANALPAEFTIAHEVGHQWWGVSVGGNSNDHTYLSEGLTQYLAIVYLEWTFGDDAADTILVRSVAGPYLSLLESSGDEIADLPIDETWDDPGRVAILYGKAALGFMAIRVEIGDDAFFAALHDFAELWAFRIAEPSDLLAAFETASGRELDELWSHWFERADTSPEEVDQLLSDS
jgi:hypothetical protein